MNQKLRWRNILFTVAMIIVLFIGFMISCYQLEHKKFTTNENQLRIKLSEDISKIEKGSYVVCDYPYMVIDNAGNILYKDAVFHEQYGDSVNVNEFIQTDHSFTAQYKNQYKEIFVMEKEGKTSGFICFMIPGKDYLDIDNGTQLYQCVMPVGISIAIVIMCIVIHTLYINKRLLKQMNAISLSANAIIAGDYDVEVKRIYETKVNENEMGQLIYSFELMRDELKEKQVREAQLKQSQQQLISCISHDLKTPISTIKAYSEGIRDGIARTEEQRGEYVKVIIKKTNLLIDMIQELLEYSNAQLQQMDINKQELYFVPFYTKLMKEIEVYVTQQNIAFTYNVCRENMLVTIDPKRIAEVVYNLVENSMKYRVEQKPSIHIQASYQKDSMLIQVIDNGIGIHVADIPYVFDMFYRAEKSRSSSIPGSGLGLSICKFIIEQHGGEIYCRERKTGCEFGFTIH